MWRSVLFPTPEAPFTATKSPALTEKSRLRKSSMRVPVSAKTFETPTAESSASLMPDGLHRIVPGRLHRGEDGGDAAQDIGHDHDEDHVLEMQVDGEHGHEV